MGFKPILYKPQLTTTTTNSVLSIRVKKDCINQKVQTIIISNKDRFIRFGYDWFERFLLNYGVNIIIVNNDKLSPNEELVQDLISIIHVFSCKIYGLRKYIKSISEDKDVNQL